MNVLLINGSCHEKGCTYTALLEVAGALEAEGIDTTLVQLGSKPVLDCIGCRKCQENGGRCIFSNDPINGILDLAHEADGFVFGSPVYYAHPSGRILSVLDRLFYAGGHEFAHKPGAAVVSARRGGTTASVDVLNKYFTICQMPVVSSTYWNMVHGNTPDEVKKDLEGLRTMRNLGRNMAWLLKCIEAGKAVGVEAPQAETGPATNFIR